MEGNTELRAGGLLSVRRGALWRAKGGRGKLEYAAEAGTMRSKSWRFPGEDEAKSNGIAQLPTRDALLGSEHGTKGSGSLVSLEMA